MKQQPVATAFKGIRPATPLFKFTDRDGLTSLAVVIGALGVWLGFPLAGPIVGLVITIAIFGIVWQSARSVVTRMLDGVEPGVIDDIG